MEWEHWRLVMTAVISATMPILIGAWHFRVKLERELALRPTFDQLHSIISALKADLDILKADNRNNMLEFKADLTRRARENQAIILKRLDGHGAKIDKAVIAAERALLLSEVMQKEGNH